MQEIKSIVDMLKDMGGIGLMIVMAVVAARYFVPKFDKWFDKHFILVDTLQEKLNRSEIAAAANNEHHKRTHSALIIIASDDKKHEVAKAVSHE